MNVLEGILHNLFGSAERRPKNQNTQTPRAAYIHVPDVRKPASNKPAPTPEEAHEALRMSQKASILAALVRGEQLTKLEMLRRFGTLAGPQHIHQLRQEGHPINTQMVLIKSRTKIAVYSIKK